MRERPSRAERPGGAGPHRGPQPASPAAAVRQPVPRSAPPRGPCEPPVARAVAAPSFASRSPRPQPSRIASRSRGAPSRRRRQPVAGGPAGQSPAGPRISEPPVFRGSEGPSPRARERSRGRQPRAAAVAGAPAAAERPSGARSAGGPAGRSPSRAEGAGAGAEAPGTRLGLRCASSWTDRDTTREPPRPAEPCGRERPGRRAASRGRSRRRAPAAAVRPSGARIAGGPCEPSVARAGGKSPGPGRGPAAGHQPRPATQGRARGAAQRGRADGPSPHGSHSHRNPSRIAFLWFRLLAQDAGGRRRQGEPMRPRGKRARPEGAASLGAGAPAEARRSEPAGPVRGREADFAADPERRRALARERRSRPSGARAERHQRDRRRRPQPSQERQPQPSARAEPGAQEAEGARPIDRSRIEQIDAAEREARPEQPTRRPRSRRRRAGIAPPPIGRGLPAERPWGRSTPGAASRRGRASVPHRPEVGGALREGRGRGGRVTGSGAAGLRRREAAQEAQPCGARAGPRPSPRARERSRDRQPSAQPGRAQPSAGGPAVRERPDRAEAAAVEDRQPQPWSAQPSQAPAGRRRPSRSEPSRAEAVAPCPRAVP